MANSLFIKNHATGYTAKDFIIKSLITLAVLQILLMVIGMSTPMINGFVTCCICFFLISVFAAKLFLKDNYWIKIVIIAVIIKYIIGIVHYLYFIDPTYFTSSGDDVKLTVEFSAALQQIQQDVDGKLMNGIFYYNFAERIVPHYGLWNFISIPFMYCGVYVMNIMPINTFASVVTAICMVIVYKQNGNVTKKECTVLFFYVFFIPVTLIPSYLTRDVVGMALMSMGITAYYISSGKGKMVILGIACYLFYLQRQLYGVILLFSAIMCILFFDKKKISTGYRYMLFLVMILLFPVVYKLSQTDQTANEQYLNSTMSINPFFIPLKIGSGLLGAFPWKQILDYHTKPWVAYQLQDYLQAVFNIGFLSLVFVKAKTYFRKSRIDVLVVTGFALMVVGLATSVMHSSYVCAGMPFLMPWLYRYRPKNYKIYFLFSILINVWLNILFIMIGSTGLSTLCK